jgi:integrase
VVPAKVMYVLALCLGLRRGELLRLRCHDVDLDGAKLEIVQTLQRVGGSLRLVPPKTADSARTVPLPAVCVTALREHRKRQFIERADAWLDWEDHGLVFPSRRGTPMEPDNLRRSWGVIRERAGLGPTRFHDLRHTGVTLLLDLGTPPHVVREIVGHSAIEVTMTIYAHVSLEEKPKGATQARGGTGMTPLLSNAASAPCGTGICAGQRWWSGAGSNRRPSAFRTKARGLAPGVLVRRPRSAHVRDRRLTSVNACE